MEYSALTASLALGHALFVVPHFIGGTAAIAAAVLRKANPLVGLVGLVFVGFVGFYWTHETVKTFHCRAAASANDGQWVEGEVTSVRHTYTRSGAGTLHFVIGDRSLSSGSLGANNDCGFIESIGKIGGIKEGQFATALLYEGKVIKFTSKP